MDILNETINFKNYIKVTKLDYATQVKLITSNFINNFS